jgi:trans-aconitate methyltransferase
MNSQTWNAAGYERNARFVTDLGAQVLQLLAPIPNEKIPDVGCGDGVLTKKIVDAGSHVVGLDSSPDLCAAARRLGLEIVEMSASDMVFEKEFDAVFSNAALHWMKDADRVVRNIARALRPQGRFVAEMGGYKCVEIIHSALVEELNCRGYDGESASPWYFPSPAEYRPSFGGGLRRAVHRIDSKADSDPRHDRVAHDIISVLHGACLPMSAVTTWRASKSA